jgi:hypothetical protein
MAYVRERGENVRFKDKKLFFVLNFFIYVGLMFLHFKNLL